MSTLVELLLRTSNKIVGSTYHEIDLIIIMLLTKTKT